VAERAVVDTGIIVSALAFGGTPRAALRELIGRSVLFVSPALLDEYRAVPGELLAARKITQEQWRVLVAGTGPSSRALGQLRQPFGFGLAVIPVMTWSSNAASPREQTSS